MAYMLRGLFPEQARQQRKDAGSLSDQEDGDEHEVRRRSPPQPRVLLARQVTLPRCRHSGAPATARGESFLRVHWVAVPEALRARRVSSSYSGSESGEEGVPRLTVAAARMRAGSGSSSRRSRARGGSAVRQRCVHCGGRFD
jgi:hypothetical protein